jgi:hypothetical protein
MQEADMMRVVIITVLTLAMMAEVHAVSLRTVIRDCGDDGKRYCPKASYGQAMQDCLKQNFSKLTPSCKVVMTKLNNGERVTFF